MRDSTGKSVLLWAGLLGVVGLAVFFMVAPPAPSVRPSATPSIEQLIQDTNAIRADSAATDYADDRQQQYADEGLAYLNASREFGWWDGASDVDCKDFRNQAEAQRFYEWQGGPGSDAFLLDSDGDGSACEALP